MSERNVLGGELELCGDDPLTGIYRDGSCMVGPDGVATHTICVVATEEFLAHQRGRCYRKAFSIYSQHVIIILTVIIQRRILKSAPFFMLVK